MEIDKSIIKKYYPNFLECGDVFKLTDYKDWSRIDTYKKELDGSLTKITHTNYSVMGNLQNIKDEQIRLNQIRDIVREVVKEELELISNKG